MLRHPLHRAARSIGILGVLAGALASTWPSGDAVAQGARGARPSTPVTVENPASRPVPVELRAGTNVTVEPSQDRLPVDLLEPVIVTVEGSTPTSLAGDTFLKFSDLTDFRQTPDKVLNGEPYIVPEGMVLLIEDVSVRLFTLPRQTVAIARVRIQRPGFNERHFLGRTDPVSGDVGRRTSIVAAAGNEVSGEVELLESQGDLVRVITHLSGRLVEAEAIQTQP